MKKVSEIKVDPEDEHLLAERTWFLAGGYPSAMVTIAPKKRKMVRLHNLIMTPPTGLVVDHINGDKLDNRRENLRVCTIRENSLNAVKKSYPNLKTQFKGVHRLPSGRWGAQCSAHKPRWIGSYDTQEDAAKAYDSVASIAYGEFAKLNFPKR